MMYIITAIHSGGTPYYWSKQGTWVGPMLIGEAAIFSEAGVQKKVDELQKLVPTRTVKAILP